MKHLLPALLLCVQCVHAQQYYKFVEKTGTYAELSAANVIPAPDFDNDKLTPMNIDGEIFNFFGDLFTFGGAVNLSVQTFGNLRIDNDSSIIIIDGIFGDLDSIDGNTSVEWQISGDPGKLTFKAQWSNVAIAAGPAGNFVNFQVWLHQESGTIELRYGGSSANNASGYNASNGPYAGIFYSNNTFTNQKEKTWLHGDPANIMVDSLRNYSFKRLNGIPPEGTIWKFIPKSYLDTVTGINEPVNSSLRIYPNPVAHTLHFDMETGTSSEAELYDGSGRFIERLPLHNNQAEVSHLRAGIYFVTVKTYGEIRRLRFVKADE